MHRDKRNAECKRGRLRKIQSYKHRTYKTGRICNTDGVNIAFRYAGDLDRSLCKAGYDLDMASRCDFRHYAAVVFKYVYLRRNDIAEHSPAVSKNGDGRLVAACLYSQCKKFSVFHRIYLLSFLYARPAGCLAGC